MKLFLDTSSDYFISLLIKEEKVLDFIKIKSNNDLIRNSNHYLSEFLEKNKISLKSIDEFYITIGPGFFTGIKISANIVNTIKILNNDIKIYIINNFNLLKSKNRIGAIKFSKNNFYIKKNKLGKIIILEKDHLKTFNKLFFTHKEINADFIYNKIRLNKFKKIKKNQKINLIFLNSYNKNKGIK